MRGVIEVRFNNLLLLGKNVRKTTYQLVDLNRKAPAAPAGGRVNYRQRRCAAAKRTSGRYGKGRGPRGDGLPAGKP